MASRPAPRLQSSGAIVTSPPWTQLTGGYARGLYQLPQSCLISFYMEGSDHPSIPESSFCQVSEDKNMGLQTDNALVMAASFTK